MTELERIKKLMETEIRLFEGKAPGTGDVELCEELFDEVINNRPCKVVAQNTLNPTIIPFIPQGDVRAAFVVIPGGAYRRQVMNLEGVDVAQWLNSLGIAAFVLKHRLPVNGFEMADDVPLIDVQRAVRMVRFNADKWGIPKEKIGVMGFSAGGHLSSLVSTCFDRCVYEAVDEIDKESARPDFAVLGYPAICLEMEEYAAVLKNDPAGVPEYRRRFFEKYSTDEFVTDKVPPMFIFETDDDRTTPAEHSVRFYLACRKAGVSAELHLFKEGSHGFGLGNTKTAGIWKELFVKWSEKLI